MKLSHLIDDIALDRAEKKDSRSRPEYVGIQGLVWYGLCGRYEVQTASRIAPYT